MVHGKKITDAQKLSYHWELFQEQHEGLVKACQYALAPAKPLWSGFHHDRAQCSQLTQVDLVQA